MEIGILKPTKGATMSSKCTKCKITKDKSKFTKNKSKPTGHSAWCKECSSKYNKLRREEAKKKNTNLDYDYFDFEIKKCSKCRQEKNIKNFAIVKHSTSGLHRQCRQCVNLDNRDRKRKLNPNMKTRDKIKCCICGDMKAKRQFSYAMKHKNNHNPWCTECNSIVEEKQNKRIINKYNETLFAVKHNLRSCKSCGKMFIKKGNSHISCKTCSNKQNKITLGDRNQLKKDKHNDIFYKNLFKSNGTKICKKCDTKKTYKNFNKMKSSYDGLQRYCNDCMSKLRSKHYQDNKPAYRKRSKAWKKNNRVQIKRRHKEAKVAWGDTTAIRLIYKEMRRLNKEAGYVKYHVDHIIPMHNDLVCGLHVETNLDIKTARHNEAKGNSFIPGPHWL